MCVGWMSGATSMVYACRVVVMSRHYRRNSKQKAELPVFNPGGQQAVHDTSTVVLDADTIGSGVL